MRKKLLAKTFAFALCTSFIFTACGKSDDNKTTSGTAGAETTTEEATTVKLEGEEVEANLASTQNVIDDNNRSFYEIFVGSFYDSDGDGMGDLQGVIDKLDYINDGNQETDTDLGCNGIWLMPISPSPSYHKYDVTDYCAVDNAYGTTEDFKKLAEECDKRGIKIIVDLVMNHSSIGHPWFQEARKYLEQLPEGQEPNAADCKYVNYYTFVKENPGGNYYKVGTSDYYYEGVFSQSMPDLNLDNPDVRAEFEAIVKYWLDLGADGFRLDAAKEYFSGNTAKNVEVLKWFNGYVKSVNPEAYIVGETWTADYASYYESGIDGAFDFSYSSHDGVYTMIAQGTNTATYNGDYFTNSLIKSMESVREYSDTGAMALFLSNHDLNRPAHYLGFNEDKIKFAHGLMGISNGSTYIYYGDEIGLGGVEADENKRSPMIWSSTDTTGQCNGPINMDKNMVINRFPSVEEQLADKNSILSYVKQSVKLRNIFPELARGEVAHISEVTDEKISAMTKTYEGSKIVVLANTSPTETAYAEVPRSVYGYTCIQGILTTGEEQPYQVGDTIVLPPHAIVILK